MPGHIGTLLGAARLSAKKFVTESRAIAQHLFSIQTGVHSEGLLCLANCAIRAARGIAIIKLEMEEGLPG